MKRGLRYRGVITALHEEEMNNRTLFYPVVRVEDEVHGQRELRLTEGSNLYRKPGSAIEVVFDPHNADEIYEYKSGMSLANVMFIIVGSLFALIGAIGTALKLFWDYIMAS